MNRVGKWQNKLKFPSKECDMYTSIYECYRFYDGHLNVKIEFRTKGATDPVV